MIKSISDIFDEYITTYNSEVGESSLLLHSTQKEKLTKSTEQKINHYKNLFNITMKESNLLKKYYFSGIVLSDYYGGIYKKNILFIMLDFLNDILYEKVPLESDEFYNRTFKKVVLSIVEDRVKEDFGDYGIYFLFSSLIRYYEDVLTVDDDVINADISKVHKNCKKMNNIIKKLKDYICIEDEFEDIPPQEFELLDGEMSLLEGHLKSEENKNLYIYRYMIDKRYKLENLLLRTSCKSSSKRFILHCSYLGSCDIFKIPKGAVIDEFMKDGILLLDKILVLKVEVI